MPALPAALDLASLSGAYARRTLTPVQMVRHLLVRIESESPPEVFISFVHPELLLARAAHLEEQLAADPAVLDRLPLFGLPFAVKDNIDVAGMTTTCACPAFAYAPERSATVVERLEAAGALLIGKTNLDQFATGLVGTRSPFGAVKNPFNPAYISGGSSSGSAAAVARGYAAFALGTDTAGSGRVPAGFCNLVGLKPTPGLISTRGVFPACRSLDCVSVFAHTVADAWQVATTLVGADEGDPYLKPPAPLGPLTRRVRLGIPRPLDFGTDARAAAAFERAVAALQDDADISITTVPMQPLSDIAGLLYDGPWVAERRHALGDFYAHRAESVDPSVRTVIAGAEGKTAVDAFAAAYRLEAGRRDAERLFTDIDVLMVPTAPTHYTLAEIAADPIARNSHLGRYTNFVNLLGLAAVALPGPFREDGLPAGVTLIGPSGADHRLAEFGRRLEPRLHTRLGVTQERPPYTAALLPPLPETEPTVSVAVVGAHLSGMPLNWQLTERGARLLRAARTAPRYRLYALPGTVPPKPGLVRVADGGAAIDLELWQMPARHYGRFVAEIPAPLGIGTLELEDGRQVQGFLCESIAVAGAEDISRYGGWRAYRAAQT